jgi:hypothetical protein
MRTVRLSIAALVTALCVSGCAVGIAGAPDYVTGTGARVNGKAFSNTGGPTDYWVKYGKTTDYGNETPHQTVSIDPEVDERGIPVNVFVEGLELGTTYHYRMCAKDSQEGAGAGCDVDKTFTTAATRQPLEAIPSCIPEGSAPFRLRDEDLRYSIGFEGVISIEGFDEAGFASASRREFHSVDGQITSVTVDAHFPGEPGAEVPPAGSWILNWQLTGALAEQTPLQVGNCG